MRLRSSRPHTICHNKNRTCRTYLRRITMMRFKDRTEAGRFLAERLSAYANRPDTLVLGLPRGGVPVAYEVATALNAPLDVFVVRKLGVPGHEELAMGAIATGGARTLNRDVIEYLRIPDELIDDGLATGSSMRAAALAVRQQQPASVVVAVPVAASQTCDDLRGEVDEVVCGFTPEPFYAVGLWYEDFSQTTDEEVRELLARAENELAGAARK